MGGGEHPSARESSLLVKTVLRDDMIDWEMSMVIHMNLLGVCLKPRAMLGRFVWPDSELLIFDWKTGEKITVGAICITRLCVLIFSRNTVFTGSRN